MGEMDNGCIADFTGTGILHMHGNVQGRTEITHRPGAPQAAVPLEFNIHTIQHPVVTCPHEHVHVRDPLVQDHRNSGGAAQIASLLVGSAGLFKIDIDSVDGPGPGETGLEAGRKIL